MLRISKNLPKELAGKGALSGLKYEVEFSSDTERSLEEKFSTVTIQIKDENTIFISIIPFCERKIDKFLC